MGITRFSSHSALDAFPLSPGTDHSWGDGAKLPFSLAAATMTRLRSKYSTVSSGVEINWLFGAQRFASSPIGKFRPQLGCCTTPYCLIHCRRTVGEVRCMQDRGLMCMHCRHRRCWPSSGKRGGLLVIRYTYSIRQHGGV